VTEDDGTGRLRGRAMIGFRFRFPEAGNAPYTIETAGLSPQAPSNLHRDVRLGPGADVTTYLTVPLTVRVLGN
jgi:hypothetical protein